MERQLIMRIEFSETLLIFAAAALWHSQVFAIIAFCLACSTAFIRYSLEWNQKIKDTQAQKEASELLTEKVQEVGSVLGTMFGNKSTMH